MAITSPFKKLTHSRESSRDETSSSGQASTHLRKSSRNKNAPTAAPQRSSQGQHQSSISSQGGGGNNGLNKKTNTITSVKSTSSSNSVALAQQYESDKNRLIKYCFSKYEADGALSESYITHVRLIEDSAFPSSKPPPNSQASNKKNRILALAVQKNGTVRLHKGRENPNGSFQIGRTWNINELSRLVREPTSDTGFLVRLGKDYYWETNSTKERQVFVTSLVRIYRKFTNGFLPILINWDFGIFGLDEEQYKSFIDKRWLTDSRKASTVSVPKSKPSSAVPSPVPSAAQVAGVVPPNQSKAQAPVHQKAPMVSSGSQPQTQRSVNHQLPQKTPVPSVASTSTKSIPSPQSPNRPNPQSEYKSLSPPKREYPSFNEKKNQYVPNKAAPTGVQNQGIPPRRPSQQSAKNTPPPQQPQFTASRRPSEQSSRRPSEHGHPYARKLSEPNVAPASSSASTISSRDLQNRNQVQQSRGLINKEPSFSRSNSQQQQHVAPLATTAPLQSKDDVKQEYNSNEELSIENEITQQLDSMKLGGVTNDDAGSSLAPSSASSNQKSIKDVEIVAHRRSMLEFEQDQDDEDSDEDDDITGLYQDAYEEHQPSPQKAKTSAISQQHLEADILPKKLEQEVDSGPEPFPEKEIQPDQSYENSFDTQDDSQEHIAVLNTPATITNRSDDEDYDDLNEVPETPHLEIPRSKRRDRSNTVDSAISATIPGLDDSESSSLDDIFDEINWETLDDSETLTQKLINELENTEYQTTKNLIDLKSKSSTLGKYSSKIDEECDKLSPLLNFFAVELSGFVRDIQHVETESKGLQVETSNKKNLWNDLQDLLNTVSVDEKSLGFLLTGDIDQDLPTIESILSDLQSAIVAIRGSDKFEEDLGNMKALKDRRAKYENVLHQFFQKVKQELSYRFQYYVRKVGKNPNNQNILEQFSNLMVYTGLTLFTKEVSSEMFYEIVTAYENSTNPLYQSIFNTLNSELIEFLQQRERFSLVSPNVYSRSHKSHKPAKRTVDTQERLRERFGIADPVTNTVPDVTNSINSSILHTFEKVHNTIGSQQDLLSRIFHLTNVEQTLQSYIEKFPIQERTNILSKKLDDVDYDRNNSKDIFNSMHSIFQPSFDEFNKSVILLLRENQRHTPFVVSYLELLKVKFGSTSQEFLFSNLKKLGDRLKLDWLKFIENQAKIIEKSTLAHRKVSEISVVVTNFTSFVDESELSLNELAADVFDTNTLEMRSLLDQSYEKLANTILKNLATDQDGQKFSKFKLHDDSEYTEKLTYSINLVQNSNWLIESLSTYKLPCLEQPLNSFKEMFVVSKDDYVNALVHDNFGKIADFVTDVENLLKDTSSKAVDPSKRNAYNRTTLNKLLSGYTQTEISKIITHLREVVSNHFSGNSSDIQRQLIDKIWSSLQAQFVSITIRLQNITEKYYKDTEPRYSKRDVIAFFNSARI
ncbi:Exocyst complex component [Wickerhamomyces ciferrii]|uniref:Exocyst complex component n=1 Tax=Wickerhamomyces ciferrii (strain ATCC 14091 / BCRC 22168 / CBS 111 / JCM 3599 / NBRC 0793 / NRRL Y-1031 F-60-10) TaxID=1206466 RepID=K0KHC6_WICCF|nr:Exocyst complex component [Wickerhamomyces ciferrii]CCH41582.1 Exocyst complex component [Wickerhamomyces ciferrii]